MERLKILKGTHVFQMIEQVKVTGAGTIAARVKDDIYILPSKFSSVS